MKKRILPALIMLLTTLVLFSTTALAARPTLGDSKKIYATKYPIKGEKWEGCGIYKIQNLAKDAVISDIKVSNDKATAAMLTKEWKSWNGKYKGLLDVYCYGIAPGRTFTVSLKVKQGGKTYRLSTEFKVYRRPSPFKSFTIGGKEYADQFKGTGALMLPLKDFAGQKLKVKWTLKDGIVNVSEGETMRVYSEEDSRNMISGGSIRFRKGKNVSTLLFLRHTDLEKEKPGSIPFKYEIFFQ